MKTPQIKFFTLEENAPKAPKAVEKAKPSGHISEAGTLIFPKATLEEIGVEPESAFFKIGAAEGKRKIKSLYLVPTEEQEGAFAFTRVGRGFGIALPVILKRGGIDFETVKHVLPSAYLTTPRA